MTRQEAKRIVEEKYNLEKLAYILRYAYKNPEKFDFWEEEEDDNNRFPPDYSEIVEALVVKELYDNERKS